MEPSSKKPTFIAKWPKKEPATSNETVTVDPNTPNQENGQQGLTEITKQTSDIKTERLELKNTPQKLEDLKNKYTENEEDGKTRATYYLRNRYVTNVLRAAYWDREESQAIIIERALDMYFNGKEYEPTPKELKRGK